MTTPDPVNATGPVGTFDYTLASDTWQWSEQLYAIHGFAPGDVVPTTELLLAHKHPDDREAAQRVIAQSRTTGDPFALWHRVVDADGVHRQVITVGAGVRDGAGALVGVRGHMVDLTEAVRRSAAREVEEAIEGLSQSRPVIEQVKGALMLTYRIDADAAFALLRRYSQLVNVKVRDVAREFVESLPVGGFPRGTRETWDRLAHERDAES